MSIHLYYYLNYSNFQGTIKLRFIFYNCSVFEHSQLSRVPVYSFSIKASKCLNSKIIITKTDAPLDLNKLLNTPPMYYLTSKDFIKTAHYKKMTEKLIKQYENNGFWFTVCSPIYFQWIKTKHIMLTAKTRIKYCSLFFQLHQIFLNFNSYWYNVISLIFQDLEYWHILKVFKWIIWYSLKTQVDYFKFTFVLIIINV